MLQDKELLKFHWSFPTVKQLHIISVLSHTSKSYVLASFNPWQKHLCIFSPHNVESQFTSETGANFTSCWGNEPSTCSLKCKKKNKTSKKRKVGEVERKLLFGSIPSGDQAFSWFSDFEQKGRRQTVVLLQLSSLIASCLVSGDVICLYIS